ncbi:MAG TPA: PAS domain S-box protein, partial [Candidatus Kryptonia bacterium]|nr:PAS domain S-box protein [Candidatus Kryptonia bacterium]
MDDILLVEDDPGQARLVQRTLGRVGRTAAWVASAAECLARVRERAPAICLLDRGLPDGDGLDVLQTIRAEAPNVCVIMLTSADDTTVAVEAMRRGAGDYILKRADLSHLTDLPLVLDRNWERLRLVRERERLDQAVRQSERRYRELFNQASDLIVVCDLTGAIQDTNDAFGTLTGYAADELRGRKLADFLAPSTPTSAVSVCERSVRSDGVTAAEIHLAARDGHVALIDLKMHPLPSSNGPRGFLGIGRDITERRRTEQMKADFLAMVTHDMKNPVSVIAGYSEILLNDLCPGSVCRDMLLSIDGSARGLLHLILNFLDLSRIEAGALTGVRVRTPLERVLRQVIESETPLARAKQIAVEVTLGKDLMIRVDPNQMDRALANLIGNAIKFTPAGGRV